MMALLPGLDQEIAAADQRLVHYLAADPVVRRLATAPGIGPVTAMAFVATLDEITRFATAHQVEAYLGLVPSERSSGERQRRGRITKAGNTRMPWLLVEAAWRVLHSPLTARRRRAAAGVGRADCAPPGQADRGGRLGPTAGGRALRDVAGRNELCPATGVEECRGLSRRPRGSSRDDPWSAVSATRLMAAAEAVHQFGAAAPSDPPMRRRPRRRPRRARTED
jgi:hypothetical protein